MLRLFRPLLLAVCVGLFMAQASLAQTGSKMSYACPMHAEVTSAAPGRCPRCNMRLAASPSAKPLPGARKLTKRSRKTSVAGRGSAAQQPQPNPAQPARPRNWATLTPAERLKELERLAPTYDYTCPMHTDIHQAQEGVCPRCGMMLVSLKPSVLGEYRLEVAATPRRPKIGEKVRLRFFISDPQTGASVKRFVLNHEKLFHLFLVSQDMTDYQHIHPELEADGSFTVETVLQRPGLYKLHADFFPVDGTPQVIRRELLAAGSHRSSASSKSAPAKLVPDARLVRTVDGMTVNLEFGGGGATPLAGAFATLKFHLRDAQTNEPVRDLEPYLGAWGHTLILNADQSQYLHSHPTEMLPGGPQRQDLRGGPEVSFGVMFPAAGDYRIWTQFQRAGKITTVSFTIRIPESPKP